MNHPLRYPYWKLWACCTFLPVLTLLFLKSHWEPLWSHNYCILHAWRTSPLWLTLKITARLSSNLEPCAMCTVYSHCLDGRIQEYTSLDSTESARCPRNSLLKANSFTVAWSFISLSVMWVKSSHFLRCSQGFFPIVLMQSTWLHFSAILLTVKILLDPTLHILPFRPTHKIFKSFIPIFAIDSHCRSG